MGRVLVGQRPPSGPAPRTFVRLRRLLAVSLVVSAGIGIHSSAAPASMCDTTSGSNCTGPQQPTAVFMPGESATIDQTMTPFAKWNGQLYPVGQTQDPTLCPSQANDDFNTICDHFQLTTQDTGSATVLITWPATISPVPANDFDLVVCIDDLTVPLDQSCLEGTWIAEDIESNLNHPNYATATFPVVGGKTYDLRVIPFDVVASDYQGCAAYTAVATTICGNPPPPPPPPPMMSTTCPSNPATANVERRINGGLNLTPDGSGNTKEHSSFNVAHKLDGHEGPFRGKVNYRKDDQIEFKSNQITCATFYDEGTDSSGHPKGSAEIRGFGKLETEDPTTGKETESPSCFRVFARDKGEPGGSKDGGSDQFSIDFTPPTADSNGNLTVCTFNDLPPNYAGRTIYSGNVDYKLKA
jgi:hypothetical protein